MSKRGLAAATVVGAIAALALVWAARAPRMRVQCGPGFEPRGARCVVPPGACPAPLARGPRGCDAPPVRVIIRADEIAIGPSDWEAEGRVPPRVVRVAPFAIDAFEVTVGAFDPSATADLARAASGMTRDDAARFCAARGGRLPTQDEWIAAAGPKGYRRYPWGDTGAVCRRAAWGLARGPCADGATGPDTVGAHPEGDTPEGIHDMAGNVAEWVTTETTATAEWPSFYAPIEGGVGTEEEHTHFVTTQSPSDPGAARGGSWATSLATDLRTWAEEPAAPYMHSARIGFRCAYDLP